MHRVPAALRHGPGLRYCTPVLGIHGVSTGIHGVAQDGAELSEAGVNPALSRNGDARGCAARSVPSRGMSPDA